jgi:hypothetical protein
VALRFPEVGACGIEIRALSRDCTHVLEGDAEQPVADGHPHDDLEQRHRGVEVPALLMDDGLGIQRLGILFVQPRSQCHGRATPRGVNRLIPAATGAVGQGFAAIRLAHDLGVARCVDRNTIMLERFIEHAKLLIAQSFFEPGAWIQHCPPLRSERH